MALNPTAAAIISPNVAHNDTSALNLNQYSQADTSAISVGTGGKKFATSGDPSYTLPAGSDYLIPKQARFVRLESEGAVIRVKFASSSTPPTADAGSITVADGGAEWFGLPIPTDGKRSFQINTASGTSSVRVIFGW